MASLIVFFCLVLTLVASSNAGFAEECEALIAEDHVEYSGMVDRDDQYLAKLVEVMDNMDYDITTDMSTSLEMMQLELDEMKRVAGASGRQEVKDIWHQRKPLYSGLRSRLTQLTGMLERQSSSIQSSRRALIADGASLSAAQP